MATTTLGQRLTDAIKRIGIKPAELARRSGATTATIANWMGDKVMVDHVKAVMLFQIAEAAEINARELLLGEADRFGSTSTSTGEQSAPSQSVQLEEWTISFQLVAEVLDERGLALPPAKRAEVTLLAHDLLQEGMPRAKVLRFVQAAAA